jgi:pyruvate formate lyase activating enzyme
MSQGIIFKIKRYALHDGPGIRTTVFLKGCPLACPWCHNPEGMVQDPQTMVRQTDTGPVDETVGRTIGVDALMAEIEKDVLFYDESGGGATFSGGEPLAQPDFLEAVLAACNRREIHAALDTSGFAPTALLERLLPRLQLVLFDLKLMDDQQHRWYTGVSNRLILDNLKRVAASRTPLRIRVPLVPGITDAVENLDQIAVFAATLEGVQGIDLLPFHRIGEAKYRRLGLTAPAIASPSAAQVAAAKDQFESTGFTISIGG